VDDNLGDIRSRLGEARAEKDALLDSAFIQTPEYQALLQQRSGYVVVGRRGTGKSALFRELKLAFAEVSESLLINAPFIYSPSALNDEQKKIVHERLLSLSGLLSAKLMLVPAYALWGRVFFLPKKHKVYEAAQNLIAIGNWLHSTSDATLEHIIKNVQEASDILGIYIPPHSRISEDLLNAAIQRSFGRNPVAPKTIENNRGQTTIF